jgi:hypothetical protein
MRCDSLGGHVTNNYILIILRNVGVSPSSQPHGLSLSSFVLRNINSSQWFLYIILPLVSVHTVHPIQHQRVFVPGRPGYKRTQRRSMSSPCGSRRRKPTYSPFWERREAGVRDRPDSSGRGPTALSIGMGIGLGHHGQSPSISDERLRNSDSRRRIQQT